jgi:hypothetical protein
MKESVALAKESNAKKDFSLTRRGNSIHRVRNEPERQISSLRRVIGNIRRSGGTPSIDSIATELSSIYSAQRASVLLALQRTYSNRYVQRVMAGIQAKLKVGQPGDIYEQEADQVAEEVMRMPEHHKLQIQRVCPECEVKGVRRQPIEKERKELLQTKEISGQNTKVSPGLESRIHAIRSGGQSLPEYVRSFFEPRFGYDFSLVRVHTDEASAKVTKVLQAQAFTANRDIFFSPGQYQPGTSEGKHLIAHELAHTIQQGATFKRTPQKIRLDERPTIEDASSNMRFELATSIVQLYRRPMISEMTSCNRQLVNRALQGARRMMGTAAPILDSLTTKVLAGDAASLSHVEQNAADRLRVLFGIDIGNHRHHDHLQTVRSRMNDMQFYANALQPNDFRCVTQEYSTCGPLEQTEAFVYPLLPAYICASAFEADSDSGRTYTMVHEIAHLAGAMYFPETYSRICSPYALRLDVANAVEHAEHYECLVRDIVQAAAASLAQEETRRRMQELLGGSPGR